MQVFIQIASTLQKHLSVCAYEFILLILIWNASKFYFHLCSSTHKPPYYFQNLERNGLLQTQRNDMESNSCVV